MTATSVLRWYRARCASDERGVVIVYLAITLVVLMAAASFTVDLGRWYLRSSGMQRAADSAALAGVVYMPNDFPRATLIALETASANGFTVVSNCTPNGSITVCVSSLPNVHEIEVVITDTSVQQSFSGSFIKNVKATRTSIAQYDLPVPLGSPENSLGTGNLPCSGQPTKSAVGTCIRPAAVWLAVNGFCMSREQGDMFASYYDANYDFSGQTTTDCPLANDRSSAAPLKEFANPLYRYPNYTYDIEVPGTGVTTTDAYTVQIYDPGYYNGNTTGDSQTAADPAGGDQQTLEWQLWKPGTGAPLVHANDLQVAPLPCAGSTKIATPCVGSFASGPSHNQTNIGGCANARDAWCTLYTIPAGSPVGQYQLTISSKANQASSNTLNNFALRGWNSTASASFIPCSNIAETDPAGTLHPANTTTCPRVHGDDAMSLYVNGQGGTTYTNLLGQTVPCNFQNTGRYPAQACSVFFLAGISAGSATAYAAKQLLVHLFDPGEGATGIHLIRPDGTLAPITYTTNDAGVEGPGFIPPLLPVSPNPGTGTCVCDTWQIPTGGNPLGIGPGNLPGRQSPGQYNDRVLDILTTIPTGLPTTSDSWYQVEYDYVAGSGGVTDRTSWSATVSGNPVHLVQ